MRLFLFAFLFPFLGFCQVRIAPWFDNKKAACVVTFDDNCPGQFQYALPALNSRSIPATFFVITGASQCGSLDWSKATEAYISGHEIGSHSVTHGMLRTMDTNQIKQELRNSWQEVKTRFPAQKGMSIAWPFGQGGGSPPKDDTIRAIASRYYFSARSASVGARGFTPYTDFNNSFYASRSFYHMIGSYLMSGGTLPSTISTLLDSAIHQGGWFTCLYHGIEDVGFNLVPLARFEQTLDSIKSRENSLWITTFAHSVKYHAQRRSSTVNIQPNGNNYRIILNSNLPDSIYDQPLTLRINVNQLNTFFNNPNQIQIRENGSIIPFLVEGDSIIQFNSSPGAIFDLLAGTTHFDVGHSFPTFTTYPNPFKGNKLCITFSVLPDSHLQVNVRNVNGQILQTFSVQSKQVISRKLELKLKPLVTGVYMVEVIGGSSRCTSKLVVID